MTLAVRIILVVSTLINFTIIGVMVAIAFDNTSLAGAIIGLAGVAVGGLVGPWVARPSDLRLPTSDLRNPVNRFRGTWSR